MVVNILHQVAILHKVRFGLERNAHAPLDKMTLEDIVENLLNGTAYHPEAQHGVIQNTDAYAQVSTSTMEMGTASIMITVAINLWTLVTTAVA